MPLATPLFVHSKGGFLLKRSKNNALVVECAAAEIKHDLLARDVAAKV